MGLGSGQGSGSSQPRSQRRPLSSNHHSQSMPCRITLTFRFGLCQLLRLRYSSASGSVPRLPGSILRSWESYTPVSSTGQAPVPQPGANGVATGSAGQWRETRAGLVSRVLPRFHPKLLRALRPCLIRKRRVYRLTPASRGDRPAG